jgi:signal transduction histidine kinase
MDQPLHAESRVFELKRFVGFGDEDARHLLAFRAIAAPHFERIASALYDRIAEHEEAFATLTRQTSAEERRRFVVAWLERLLGGIYDTDYFERVEAIGRAHARSGLPQRFVFGAMSAVRTLLGAISTDLDVARALGRVLDLELALMVEAYQAELRPRLVRRARADAASTLATGFAHELRNPLNGAQLHLAVLARELARTGASADLCDAASVVDGELKRLARFITEFLDFVRPKPYALAPTDLRGVCQRVIERVPVVRLELPPSAVCVMGDPAALARALANVVENALEAVGPSGGSVVVRVHGEAGTAWIDVDDDGPGIVTPDAPIFDAFYSTKTRGTGLGLAIVHRVLTDHGGTVDVESKPGHTCFRLRLPVIDPRMEST